MKIEILFRYLKEKGIRKGIVRIIFVVIGAMYVCPVFSGGLNDKLEVKRLEGLPQNDINCIFIDSKGYIWIGTLDGLHRYDGYSYKTYRKSETLNSIPSNMIINIDEDTLGNLWISTYGKGLCKLNTSKDEFTTFEYIRNRDRQFTSDITHVMVDNKNILWVGNWFGISRIAFDKAMSKIEEVIHLPMNTFDVSPSLRIKNIFQDSNGEIWIGFNEKTVRLINPYRDIYEITFDEFACSGVTITDFENGVLVGGAGIVSISNQGKGKYTKSSVSEVLSDALLYNDSTIWCGSRQGLIRLRKKNGNWVIFDEYRKGTELNSISSNLITSITSNKTGLVFIGTRGGGVNTIDTKEKGFQHYKSTGRLGSIKSNIIRTVFEDANGDIWIGTEENGVALLRQTGDKNYTNGFEHISINDFNAQDRVYAIEEIFTPRSNKYKSLIWLGTSYPSNLVVMDQATLERKQTTDVVSEIGFVFSIEKENDSIIWVGSYGQGLWRLNLNNDGDITGYKNFLPRRADSTSILSVIIRSIHYSSKGDLWIGTDKGISLIQEEELNNEEPKFISFKEEDKDNSLKHDYILQIFESNGGVLWFGSMGGGLIRLDYSSGNYIFKSVTVDDGLPSNTVKSILEDDDGKLWLATNQGISNYDPRSGDVINYDIEDGLQHREFSEICAVKRKSSEMIFGGINGFNTFYPGKIGTDTVKPRLVFTDFFILNERIRPGQEVNGRVILDKSIEYTDKLKLKYIENSFSISFVGLQYNSPLKNRYKYKLEGFDPKWYNSSPEHRIAKYTNVPPGDYVFKMWGANSDNVWADKPIELAIRINQPLYLSKVALLIYFILLLVIVHMTYKILKLISTRKRELLISNLERKKLEEITQVKLRYFTNISHEFRTPLTLISAPLEKLISGNHVLSPIARENSYNTIQQNVKIMLRLVNQLLDFRKMEQDKMKLRAEQLEINLFMERIFKSFEPWAAQKEIKFVFIPNSEKLHIWFDPDKMEKVFYNLLSNAFKFTPEKGSVEIRIIENKEKGQSVISIKDSGIGIGLEDQAHVFERYHQSEEKRKNSLSGTGIGLALSKGLVEFHKGDIFFTSEKNKGTTFFVGLPLGKDHLEVKSVKTKISIDKEIVELAEVKEKRSVQTEKKNEKQHRYNILLIEDNDEVRSIVADVFNDDYNVIEADDGPVGFELAKKHVPDIIVCDINIPKMNGIELCRKTKITEALSHVPVILLTAQDTEESRIEGFNAGADDYITKPFNSELLKARVVSLMKNRRHLRYKFQKEIQITPMIIANSPADSKFLDQILAIIENNISDSEFSVEKLADKYGVSRIYLNRKIKSLTGETSNQFLRNIRLKHAAELLKQNVLTVSEVTWQVGYNDLRTFRSRFKEKFGISPSEYAKKYGSN